MERPCENLEGVECNNTAGSFQCICSEGYNDVEGACVGKGFASVILIIQMFTKPTCRSTGYYAFVLVLLASL